MKIDKKNINYQVKTNLSNYKEIDESSRIIKAILNTYDYFDFDADVLRVGSAKNSINQRGANSQATDKILYAKFHDLQQLPGKSLTEQETVINGKNVLYGEAKLIETPLGEETLIQYKEGIINQHSIGFKYLQLEYLDNKSEGWSKFLNTIINPEDAEKVGYAYEVTEINLHEWSAVSFGANKLTEFLGTKGANKNIQYQNLITKFDSLIKKANRRDKLNKKTFELQILQLKQMMYELITKEQEEKLICKNKPTLNQNSEVANFYANLIH